MRYGAVRVICEHAEDRKKNRNALFGRSPPRKTRNSQVPNFVTVKAHSFVEGIQKYGESESAEDALDLNIQGVIFCGCDSREGEKEARSGF